MTASIKSIFPADVKILSTSQVHVEIIIVYELNLQELLIKWRLSSLSELTPMIYNMGLTHLGPEDSRYFIYVVCEKLVNYFCVVFFLYSKFWEKNTSRAYTRF